MWCSVLPVLFLLSLTSAAPVDPKAILDQLKKNGACCTALNYFLPGKVFTVTDIKYQSSQASFWSEQEQSIKPTCIVIPTSTQDVSTAVTVLNVGYQANVKGCKFAVRGAGHTPQGGAANIDGGVTLDLQSMNQVTVSSDQKTVSIGPGNRWGNVYSVLDDLNLAMVGGRVTPVGTAGLLTGGGVSFFSGRYGFACNNIQTYEVVLANGTIVTASSSSNPTLYRALRGGSNNFGIVTRFDSMLFSQDKFWGGTISQPITNKEAFFDFFVKFSESANFDPYAALISDFAWLAGVPSLIHNVAYTDGSKPWPPPAYKPLDDMPKVATTVRKDHISSFANEIATAMAVTTGGNNLFLTLTFVNRPEITAEFMAEAYDLADEAQKELLSVVGLIYTMTFQPLPQVLYSKGASSNVLGLDRFQDDLINCLFTLSWQLPLDNDRVYTVMKKLENDIAALEKDKSIFNEFIYLNYAAEWQNPIQGYGTTNVQFMKDVSKRYDPNGVFQKAVPGGFKLGI